MDAGIVEITAENFGTKDSNAANTAAIRITLGSYTRDSSNTPVFSPYVVFAGILLNAILPGNDYTFGKNPDGDQSRGVYVMNHDDK